MDSFCYGHKKKVSWIHLIVNPLQNYLCRIMTLSTKTKQFRLLKKERKNKKEKKR